MFSAGGEGFGYILLTNTGQKTSFGVGGGGWQGEKERERENNNRLKSVYVKNESKLGGERGGCVFKGKEKDCTLMRGEMGEEVGDLEKKKAHGATKPGGGGDCKKNINSASGNGGKRSMKNDDKKREVSR